MSGSKSIDQSKCITSKLSHTNHSRSNRSLKFQIQSRTFKGIKTSVLVSKSRTNRLAQPVHAISHVFDAVSQGTVVSDGVGFLRCGSAEEMVTEMAATASWRWLWRMEREIEGIRKGSEWLCITILWNRLGYYCIWILCESWGEGEEDGSRHVCQKIEIRIQISFSLSVV